MSKWLNYWFGKKWPLHAGCNVVGAGAVLVLVWIMPFSWWLRLPATFVVGGAWTNTTLLILLRRDGRKHGIDVDSYRITWVCHNHNHQEDWYA